MKEATKIRIERWPNRKTANRLEPECWPALRPSFRFSRNDAIFAIGSCFARNIEAHLAMFGFNVPAVTFRKEHVGAAEILGPGSINRFTPPSIYQELSWTRAIMDRDDTVCMGDIEGFLYDLGDGKVVDLHFRGGAGFGVTPGEALTRRQLLHRLFRDAFTCDVIVITLGLIECWRDTERNHYVEFSPGLHRGRHPFVFEQLDYEKCRAFVQQSIDLINRDSRKRILITTSPIPLNRTFTEDDVIVANTYSKSVLRAVSQVVANRNDGVDYFPSYESAMLTKRSEIWTDDLVHLEPAFIGRIMARVTEAYAGDEGRSHSARVDALRFIEEVNHKNWTEAAAILPLVGGLTKGTIPPTFFVCLAEFHLHHGDRDAAAAVLSTEIDALNDLTLGLHLRAARAADAIGLTGLGDSHRNSAITWLGRNVQAWATAIAQTKNGHSDDLLWLVRQAEERCGDNADILGQLMDYYMLIGRDADVGRIHSRLIELQPTRGEVPAKYGIHLLKAGRKPEAVALVPGLCKASFSDNQPLRALAFELMKLNDFTNATLLLQKLLEGGTSEALIHELLGRCALRTGDPANAIVHFRESLRIEPEREPALKLLDHATKLEKRIQQGALKPANAAQA